MRRGLLQRPGRIKRLIYWVGHRPRPGLLYSPSLALIYGYRDAMKRDD